MSGSATLEHQSLKDGRSSQSSSGERWVSTALLVSCDKAVAGQLERLCTRLELTTVLAGSFDVAAKHLQRQAFALWILNARKLPLQEPFFWASLRFAGERTSGAQMIPPPRTPPVLVLIPENDGKAFSALSAAASSATITSWNRSGWRLGLQEIPCADERLLELLRHLLTDS